MDNIFIRLSSLGCNFALSNSSIEADPEKTIIEGLDYFWSDKKVFTMLLGLLRFRIFHLINTKRLYALSNNLSSDKKALLAVVAIKVYKYTADSRYRILFQKLKKDSRELKNVPLAYQDSFYIGRRGVDKEFNKLNARVANFFDDQTDKKFKTQKLIYSENLWLKLRALVGPEYRADVIYLLFRKRAASQSDAAKILGCHKSSISRIWGVLPELTALFPVIN